MNKSEKKIAVRRPVSTILKDKVREILLKIKQLNGDPHYVALGLAVGVFIGITPTIPFHTVIAIGLAFVMKCSKAGAAIGVWISNPVTIPFFYVGSYKLGAILMGNNLPFDPANESLTHLFKMGLDVTAAMLLGGAALGLLPAVVTYFAALVIIRRVRQRAAQKAAAEHN